MTVVNMLDAKSTLSELVAAVENGTETEIIIARNGKPAARLVPLEDAKHAPIRIGLHDGKFPVMTLEDFNALDAAVAETFGIDPQ